MTNFLNKLDLGLFLLINQLHLDWLNPIMVFLSGQFIWIPMIVFFFWKAKNEVSRRPMAMFFLFLVLAIVLSDVTSSYILKNLVTRFRPCRLEELQPLIYQFGQKCGGKYGFVSSHAANSVALIYFSLRALKLPARFHLIWILPALVSYSRVYLGVHYPGDILGGVGVGLFWGSIALKLYQKT